MVVEMLYTAPNLPLTAAGAISAMYLMSAHSCMIAGIGASSSSSRRRQNFAMQLNADNTGGLQLVLSKWQNLAQQKMVLVIRADE
jgi:hypothetical protein